jgi:two-component system response regulator DesR
VPGLRARGVRLGRQRAVIRILIAEDATMIRGALIALLTLEDDLDVIAEVGRGDEIVPAAQRWIPDVAVIDVDLPGLDGLTAAKQLRSKVPDCRVLILTGLGLPGTLRRAMDAEIGGFLRKDAPPAQLADAVRKVAAREHAFDPGLALAAWVNGSNPLTLREAEILLLAAEGTDPREIGTRLHLSAGTVRNYLTTIVDKLNARNRIDAVRIAQEAGWLHLTGPPSGRRGRNRLTG